MDKQDERIQHKLIALESEVIDESKSSPPEEKPATTGLNPTGSEIKSDLYYLSGLAFIGMGLLLFFNHIKVGTGLFSMLGMGGGGFGFLILPLLIGIGWVLYDSKNRIGWAIIAASCALILFSVISALIMTFPTTSLLGLIMMLMPFAVGGTLLLKAAGGPEGVRQKLKTEGYIK